MELFRKCNNCQVEVSKDLSNCPLCGKYLLKNNEKIEENKYSFPVYSMSNIYRAKWVNIIRTLFWIAGIISVIVNLIFKTTPYFFPYVITALIMLMTVFIQPLAKKGNYLKSITNSSIILSLFLIFIDVYDHYTIGTTFGWGLSYSAPLLLSVTVISSAIICLVSKRLEVNMMNSVGILMIYSIIYFFIVLLAFPSLVIWPSLVFMFVSTGWFFLLQTIKHNLIWKEIKKNFHI